jgi:hypothetical protein
MSALSPCLVCGRPELEATGALSGVVPSQDAGSVLSAFFPPPRSTAHLGDEREKTPQLGQAVRLGFFLQRPHTRRPPAHIHASEAIRAVGAAELARLEDHGDLR